MWVKKCKNGAIQGLYGNTYSNTHRGYLYFDSSDRLNFFDSSGTSLVLIEYLEIQMLGIILYLQ